MTQAESDPYKCRYPDPDWFKGKQIEEFTDSIGGGWGKRFRFTDGSGCVFYQFYSESDFFAADTWEGALKLDLQILEVDRMENTTAGLEWRDQLTRFWKQGEFKT